MKTILIVLFLSSFSFVSAQKDFSIDVLTGLDYSSASSVGFGDDFKVHGLHSLKLGANFNFRIFDNIMFKTGIRYTKIGEVNKIENLRWPSEINAEGEFVVDPSLPRSITSSTRHRFIEIPLMLRKEFEFKRLSPFIELGMSTLFYTKTKLTSKSEISQESDIYDYREYPFAFNTKRITANISLGANYNIRPSLQLYSQLNFQQHLSGEIANPSFDVPRIHALGLEIGIRKQFGSYFSAVKS